MRYLLSMCLYLISLCSQAVEMEVNKEVLEKYIEITNSRKCDPKNASAIECSCKVAIQYPIFTAIKDIISRAKINDVVTNYISIRRAKINKCQARGEDFGQNGIKYEILFENDEYLSLIFKSFYCCNSDGQTNNTINVYNFNKKSGDVLEFKDVFLHSNFDKAQTLINSQLNNQIGRPESYKNNILISVKNEVGEFEPKLKENAFFYFSSFAIKLKILPDQNDDETFDIEIPNEFVKERIYTSKNVEQLMNDNQIKPYIGTTIQEE